jgi:hypothetical protein
MTLKRLWWTTSAALGIGLWLLPLAVLGAWLVSKGRMARAHPTRGYFLVASALLELLVAGGCLHATGSARVSGGFVGDGLAVLFVRLFGEVPTGLWVAFLSAAGRDAVELLVPRRGEECSG